MVSVIFFGTFFIVFAVLRFNAPGGINEQDRGILTITGIFFVVFLVLLIFNL